MLELHQLDKLTPTLLRQLGKWLFSFFSVFDSPIVQPSFRDKPFCPFRRIDMIAPSRFLRLELLSVRNRDLWVPKMPSESFRPEFHQIDEFNFDSAFVNSDNSASHSLGQTNLRKIRPSFRDGPFALFRRIILIAPSRFLRLDLSSISIREHN
jgi:hypothetical protein